ncbi:CPBP family intramembrane glutamic endopeptidase [Paenimyroides viscosum]|uniref:CPBP family intramembrane metalloprotease n=1 Tax=Paenimyroides viscosum TaxID=2488729 RepID=A0A3P1B0K9_9FLAO|nr:CPBP family intramembrane glutamic endopeptidase [Paenimyroides viscosum]RRA93862.1 CPBP family intramembrane metalloprotease [Paenimyroides viscosum]
MKQILLDFWQFIKHPKDLRDSSGNKWKVFFTLFLAELALLAIYLPVIYLIDKYFAIENATELNFNIVLSFLLLILLVPFIEEVFFRLGLRRKGLVEIFFTEQQWEKYFPIFIYSSSIIFGIVHISNYANFSWTFIVLSPILILTQLTGGFILAYLRVRFNFWLSFLYHALWNFTAIFLLGSLSMFFVDTIDIKTNDYELQVKHQLFVSLTDDKTITFEQTEEGKIKIIQSDEYSVSEMLEILNVDFDNYVPESVIIDLNFKSNNGISNDSLLIILEENKLLKKR